MQETTHDIVIFLIVSTILVIATTGFVISILYLYRRRQLFFEESLAKIKSNQEKSILNAQLEIQEQTFQHISREIHDNINLSLTLAKLNLHTIDWNDNKLAIQKVNSSIELLSKSISELSDISKSLNADIFIQHGFLNAVEEEIFRIKQAGLFDLDYRLIGNPAYMTSQRELIIFRIIQEAFNNIIRHSSATLSGLSLSYTDKELHILINDNGTGFIQSEDIKKGEAGIRNMASRTQILNGTMSILSVPGQGTMLSFLIPVKNGEQQDDN
jgi:two-component system NarL family sensor kinase